MAPEKINWLAFKIQKYGVESDVWSFGLTMLESSTGHYPYAYEQNDQEGFLGLMNLITTKPAPELPDDDRFTHQYRQVIKKCLNKDFTLRPKYPELKQDPLFLNHKDISISNFVRQILE